MEKIMSNKDPKPEVIKESLSQSNSLKKKKSLV